jgi:selenide,water dikinase
MTFPTDENVLVGLERADDAGVYKINDELALIQTVDFFTPVVDDPYQFGQIAAANALSDIYAMGGTPKTAMNLVGFPLRNMDISILRQVIQGGSDKIKEAGAVLVGGHSVEDRELKYGLSVTGFIHPDKILTKKTLQKGDRLVLTKPLGTGIVNTAIKRKKATAEVIETVTRMMAELNKNAAEIMAPFKVSACTDITGFGLLGHLAEMVESADVGIRLYADQIPIIPEAVKYAKMGLITGGGRKNRHFREGMVESDAAVDPRMVEVLYDPQTSGGLLIGANKTDSDSMVFRMRQNGMTDAAVIGEVIDEPQGKIVIRKSKDE